MSSNKASSLAWLAQGLLPKSMDQSKHEVLAALALGKKSAYSKHYAPELLQPVPRRLNREELGIAEQQPFSGVDVWHAYELSWLNAKGKPMVALARLTVDASSPNIIESKSFKLYLNSLNQTRFESNDAVLAALATDLSKVAGAAFQIELFQPDDLQSLAPSALHSRCIDDLDIELDAYELSPDILHVDASTTSECLHSHILKSNCLITDQPDWATVIIEYSGPKINRESLLRYLISFREHNEFHEQCVERIFCDIQQRCQPHALSVQALYTRRGGLDINPFRSSDTTENAPLRRINRQ